jgi:methylglutaconyl-CoA hydratase
MEGSDRGKNQARESAGRGLAASHSNGAAGDSTPASRRVHDPNAEGPLGLKRQDGALIISIEREERRDMSLDEVRAQLQRYRTDLAWLSTCPVPTVAAINGAALGGGLELALLCDLRVAAPHASFALPETSLGIIPAAGGTQYLPRIVGSAKARELILLGSRVSAAEALRIGLIHRICDAAVSVVDDALAWIAPITRGAPLAQHAALRALRAADRLDIDAGLEFERACYEECLMSEDRIEALNAFAEKREPLFKGH